MESARVNQHSYQSVQEHGQANPGGNYLSQGYRGQMTVHHDIAEEKARDNGAKFDPDVAFSYMDLKLQNALGHIQKEFEGGVSADKLGPKFGGYGSFLPAWERSPSVLRQPKPTAAGQNHNNEGTVQHVRQQVAHPVSAVTSTKLMSLANKNPSGSGALASDFANEDLTAANAVKDNDPTPAKVPLAVNDVKNNNQKKLKLRFKMASDFISPQKNAAIYSGLGLEHSSSPSLEDSPHKLEKVSTEAQSNDLSPFSIIQIMTSQHIPGSCLLSPLRDSVLNLLELKEEPCQKKDGTTWAGVMGIREGPSIDNTACKEIREQKEKDDITGVKFVNFKEQVSGLRGVTAKEETAGAEINSRVKDNVPNCPKFTSKSSIKEACPERLVTGIACDTEKGGLKGVCFTSEAPKTQIKDRGFKSSLPREEHKEAVVRRDPGRHVKTERGLMPKHVNETPKQQRPFRVMEEKKGIVCKDFISDMRKTGIKTLRDQKKIGLQKDSTPLYKGKDGHKDETKGALKEKVPGRVVIHETGDRLKQHGQEVGAESKIKQKDMAMSKAEVKEKANSGLKHMHKELRKDTHEKDPLQSETFDEGVKRNKEVIEATAKEFSRNGMKDGRKEQLDVTRGIVVTHHQETLKCANFESFEREPSRVVEKEKDRGVAKGSSSKHLKCASTTKVHASNSVVSQPLPVQTAIVDACLAQVAPVVINENWVCCDACGKWRLLPYGVEDTSLPTNWLCHMIYWLPGLNSCDVGEDEASQAYYALYGQPVGVQVEANQGHSLPAAASVSMPTLDSKEAEQGQEPKSLKSGTKSGSGKKGQVQKQTAKFSGTTKFSGLVCKKNEPLPHKGNISGVKDLKHKGKEKAKIKKISEGPDTEVAIACPLKVKRRREAQSKEDMFSKKAKTKDSKGHDTEMGESAPLKIRTMKSKLKKHEDVKMVKSEGMECAREDLFEENESSDRADPLRHENEPVKLSGGPDTEAADAHPLKLKRRREDKSKEHIFAKKPKTKDSKGHDTEMGDSAILKRRIMESDWEKHKDVKMVRSEDTDSLKRDSCHRPVFASEASSSSKVSCHPKIVSTLQDVRGSPVESTVSSSAVRSFKVGKLQLARRNSTGLDDLMHFRRPSPRRCSDGEGDAQNDPSGPRTKVVGSMVRAMDDTVGRDGKQFSNDKIKYKNVHKKQGMGCSDAGNFGSGLNNLPFANDVKCSNEMKIPDGSQAEYSKHKIMNASHERKGGGEISLSGKGRERVKSCHDKVADKLHGYTTDGKKKGSVNERNPQSEGMLSGHHEAHSAPSKDLYDDKLTCKEDKEPRNCMAFNGNKDLKSKTSSTSFKGNQLQQNMGQSKEMLNFGSHSSHAKRHKDTISRPGKDLVSNCKDGKPKSQQSLHRDPFVAERASEQYLPESNALAEIALVKAKPKVSSYSVNTSKVQGSDTVVGFSLNKGSQLQGSAGDASNSESPRGPRESVAVANRTQSCDVRPPVSNGLVRRDAEGTGASPTKKEPSQAVGNAALKEAKDLKHKADRLKSIGDNELESTSLYFRASLKFLHGASILEPCNADGLKHGESQSMTVYADTAKLCEFCAGAYERNNEMAAAALAYKCKGVAHMRVVVAKNELISRDRHELQAAAQAILPGESPSSSASDIDNLNNHALMDRDLSMDQAKGAESLQVPGTDVIVARQCSRIARLLQYTEDVNAAVEAFAKAENALVAARHSRYGPEDISAVKRAIDFNFCDIDGLLRLVLLAMEAFDH